MIRSAACVFFGILLLLFNVVMCVERTAASSVYLGILAFLSHRRLFNYFKVR